MIMNGYQIVLFIAYFTIFLRVCEKYIKFKKLIDQDIVKK